MTAQEFRELALSFPGASEGEHMSHPDFRAHGRIFATLAYPDESCGMVKLSPPEQKQLVEQHPRMFSPVKGAWGLQGSTTVHLLLAKVDVVQHALDLAWQASVTTVKPVKKRAGKLAKNTVT